MTEPYARQADSKVYVPYAIDTPLTIDATAGGVALTAANVQGCKRAIVSVETAQIRYTTTSNLTVTSANGLLANPGDQIILIGPEVQAFKAIRTGASSAALTTEYSR